jgi:hypothetical protein
MYTEFWSEIPKGRDHSDDLDLDGRIIVKLFLEEWSENLWAGFI